MKKLIVSIILYCFFSNFVVNAGDIKGIVKSSEGELENAVVYIEKISGKSFNPPEKPALIDQKDLTFIPHVLPILAGTTVVFPNSDPTRHSVFSPGKTKKFDFGTYSQGTKKSIIFDKPGVVPLLCHVHPEMSAYIIVVETPYFDVSDEKGFYKIKDIPPGNYNLTIWHEWAQPKVIRVEVKEKGETTVNFNLDD